MFSRMALLASALTAMALIPTLAGATVIYSVTNPSANFVFFVYESPTFITSDTLVTAAELTFNNTIHPAKTVEFIIASPLEPGYADVQITIDPSPPTPTVQDKFVLAEDLTIPGHYQAAPGSVGYPNTYVDVAVPEPASLFVFGIGVLGLAGVRRARSRD